MKMKYELDQVAIRMVKEPPLMSDHPIRGPEDAIDILADAFCDLDRYFPMRAASFLSIIILPAIWFLPRMISE